jgi:hypothetical protein
MTAEIVHQACEGNPAVLPKPSGPCPFLRSDTVQDSQSLPTRPADGGECFNWIGGGIAPRDGECISIHRRELGIEFGSKPVEADMVALGLDVTNVTELAQGREGLTGHALPRGRCLGVVTRGNEQEMGGELLRELSQSLPSGGIEHEA